MYNLYDHEKIANLIISFHFDWDLNANVTFGFYDTSYFEHGLVKNRCYLESPFIWNINYQGVLYDDEVINERNMTWIYAQVYTIFNSIALPPSDFLALFEKWS